MFRKLVALICAWLIASPLAYAGNPCPSWESYAAVRGRSYTDGNINPQLGDVLTSLGWAVGPPRVFTATDTTIIFPTAGTWARATRVASFSNSCDLCSVNQDSVGGYIVTMWRTPPGNWVRTDSILISNSTPVTDTLIIRPYEQMCVAAVALSTKLPDTLAGAFMTECALINFYPVTRAR